MRARSLARPLSDWHLGFLIEKGVRTIMRIVLVWIQRPQQRAALALLHRFCFAEKLDNFGNIWSFLAIFGHFLNKKSGRPLSKKSKKIQKIQKFTKIYQKKQI
jgi:hypothetical protein